MAGILARDGVELRERLQAMDEASGLSSLSLTCRCA
jgi:hypothetical protein